MRVRMGVILLMMMMGLARGERMTITNVSEDLMVRRGESVNMTCTTDQVNRALYSVRSKDQWIEECMRESKLFLLQ